MARRRGVTLVELLCVAIPALLLLGLVLHLILRGFSGDRWQAARLGSLDAVLIAAEHLRADLAASPGGQVQIADGALSIGTGDALAAGASTRAVYGPIRAGFLDRNGKPVRGAPLSGASWAWDARAPALLHLELTGDAAGHVRYQADVHVPDRAARLAYPGFAER